MKTLDNMIQKCQVNEYWDFSNSILYDLCRNHPKHNENKYILSKIWLIGRSYAAAIERRKNNDDSINDDFYTEIVVPKIKKSNIDQWIKKCTDSKKIKDILIVHKNLTDLFFELTDLNKRSLASKYLHFHCPELFYIYDSRVVKAMGKLNIELRLGNSKKESFPGTDMAYSIFYTKCNRAIEKIQKDFKITLNCRQLDNLLIEIANNELR